MEVIDDYIEDGDEFDNENLIIVRAKWTIDGAKTLEEAAEMSRRFADYLQELHDSGHTLEYPVADDYGFVNPPSDKVES